MDRLLSRTARLDFYFWGPQGDQKSAESAALRSAGLHGFILARAYQKTPLNQTVATIVWKWPEILRVTELLEPPSMHEIPIGRQKRLRQILF
jgi:hypothetical protein